MIRKKILKFVLFLSLFLGLSSLASTTSVFAESIKSFDDTIVIHKDGTTDVTENIQYDFGDVQHHGITRDIPLDTSLGNNLYRVLNINVGSVLRDGQPEQYAVSNTADNNLEIKIGNPGYTMTGTHDYVVSYSVSNGIGNYADHDEFYWNVTGTGWSVPIMEASANVKNDLGLTPSNSVCYTGVYGSKATNCVISDSTDAKVISTNVPLNPNEGFSFALAFPLGTFPKSVVQQIQPVDYSGSYKVLSYLFYGWLIINILGSVLAIVWYRKTKHQKRFGPVTVNFDLPKTSSGARISPAQAATIDQPLIDSNCISATIFDLGVRHYLKIEEINTKGGILGLGKSTDYKLTKLKTFADLNDFEKTLTSDMFGDKSEVYLSDEKLTYTQFNNLQTTNYNQLVDKGLYNKSSDPHKIPVIIFAILSFISLNFVLGIVLIIMARKFTNRTAEGDLQSWKIKGLELFLKNMKPEYQWQADKVYVVEQMIPYAISLGYIDKFMQQLQILNPQYQPTFYTGNRSFYLMYPAFASSFRNSVQYAAPASSSGFSSGGFSGGGGGGGGGGSW